MGWAAFGGQMLQQLGSNLSNRIGTGASLRRQMSREQVKQTQAEAAAGIIGRVEGAKAAGIHPLVAMGSNVGGASLPVGNSFNAIGGDLGFAQSAMQRRELQSRREELEFQKQQEASRASSQAQRDALDAQESRARIALTTAQTEAQRKQMSDSDRDFAASQAQLARQQSSHALRVPNRSKGMPDMFVPVKDRYGKVQYIPNPQIYDLELPETVGAGTLVVPELERGQPGNVFDRAARWWEKFKGDYRKSHGLDLQGRRPQK